jgi:hypothetical protein
MFVSEENLKYQSTSMNEEKTILLHRYVARERAGK